MSYIEVNKKKDRSPGSFSRHVRLKKTINLVPISIDGNGNAI